jgi:hypothetical protein
MVTYISVICNPVYFIYNEKAMESFTWLYIIYRINLKKTFKRSYWYNICK